MIINRIGKYRNQNQMTQQELADKLNISRQTLISIEDNKENISLKLAFEISKILNKNIYELFIEQKEKGVNEMLNNVEEVRLTYGKNTIIIKDDLVFRCSTEKLEIGPRSLIHQKLPNYGQMNKFIVLDGKVYKLIPTRKYDSRTDIVYHTIGEEVNIDYSFINFDATKMRISWRLTRRIWPWLTAWTRNL